VLYTAVLVACLAASPIGSTGGECRTHEMLINAGASPVTAYVEAQIQAAEWLSKHPELAQQSLTIRPGRTA
jgi:hypothetical protein